VQSQSKGGLGCIYAPEDVTITLSDIYTMEVTNARANKGVCIYILIFSISDDILLGNVLSVWSW